MHSGQIHFRTTNIHWTLDVLFISSGKYGDKNANDTSHVGYGHGTNRIVNVYLEFLKVQENVAIFWTAPDLEIWLNGMTYLEREFILHFHRIQIHLAIDISTNIKRLLVFYFFVPTVLWLVSMYIAFASNIVYSPWLTTLGYSWFFTNMYVCFCEPLLEDVKIFVMLDGLGKLYNRFHQTVGKDVGIHNGAVGANNIHFWR